MDTSPEISARIAQTIATEIGAGAKQVSAAVALLDEGATVPFVARYRKEATGGLDDSQLRTLDERLSYLRELEARRASIVETIKSQDKLTDDLAAKIAKAETKAQLEDIYLPYKPKRRTKAMIARENGLEPLAEAILADRSLEPEALAEGYVSEAVPTVKDALNGARDILTERLTEDADLLGRLRDFLQREAYLTAKVVEGKEQEGAKFSDYFDHRERWADVPSHRALAMLRGSNEGVLTLDIGPDPEEGVARAEAMVAAVLGAGGDGPGDKWLRKVAGWTWGETVPFHDAGADGRSACPRAGGCNPGLCAQPQGPSVCSASRCATNAWAGPGHSHRRQGGSGGCNREIGGHRDAIPVSAEE